MPYWQNKYFTTSVFENTLYEIYERLKEGDEIIIDLKKYDFFDLGALTYILAFCSAIRTNKLPEYYIDQPIKLIPPINRKAQNYIIRSGLFDLPSMSDVFITPRGYEKEKPYDTGNSYPFMPFKFVVEKYDRLKSNDRFEFECSDFISFLQHKFRHVLKEQLGFPKIMVDTFWSPNIEIISNIYYHSNSWGLGAIQSTSKGVTICYADIGRGVKETLEPYRKKIMTSDKRLRSWNDGSAILGAFMQGVTSQEGESRGQGLFILKNYVVENKGYLEFRSGRAKVVFSHKQKPKGAFVGYIPGVQINIWLPKAK